jgi:hypothetical protein
MNYYNRDENEVKGLPVQGKEQSKILLTTFQNSIKIIRLKNHKQHSYTFNGGIKDGPTNQTSSLHLEWRAACEFAKRINEALQDGTIIVNEKHRKLTNYDGSDEIIL